MQTTPRSKPRQQTGFVVSNKMQKTIVVKMTTQTRHPVYKKVIRQEHKFKVHDEKNAASVGDKVIIAETRPISKDKRWRLVTIVQKANPEITG